MDKYNLQHTLLERLYENRKGFFRLWLFLGGLYLVCLLLGIDIFIIVFGIQFAARRIILYWSPARNWLAKTFGLILPEPDTSKVSLSYTLLVNIYHLFIALLLMAFGLYTAKVGIDMLIRDGFLGQNLIYMIFFR